MLFIAAILVVFSAAGFAHHSISVEFDAKRPITLTGTLTKIEWTNPHAFLFIDVRDPLKGNIVGWVCELASPNTLARLGWTQDRLKTGTTMTLPAFLLETAVAK